MKITLEMSNGDGEFRGQPQIGHLVFLIEFVCLWIVQCELAEAFVIRVVPFGFDAWFALDFGLFDGFRGFDAFAATTRGGVTVG